MVVTNNKWKSYAFGLGVSAGLSSGLMLMATTLLTAGTEMLLEWS